MPEASHEYKGNIDRFTGFADLYDRFRPTPPTVLAEVLIRLVGMSEPDLVVDLGSGTGLSTRYWAGKAQKIVGIEPSDDMRRQAEQIEQTNPTGTISYRSGYAHQTGLPDRCADIIACSQSLHWMEPQTTFAEARRVLHPGGVFAAFDYDWPPTTGNWEADQAFEACMAQAQALEAKHGSASTVQRWGKSGHLQRMLESGCFSYVKEIAIHHKDTGNADRLVGLARSQGMLMSLLKLGLTEDEVGLDALRVTAERTLGREMQPWFWTSRIRIGIPQG